jgi:hypothetical protein
MKIKTSELIGTALDFAVMEAEGGWGEKKSPYFHPSTDWAQGGPIIEREEIEIVLTSRFPNHVWTAIRETDEACVEASGPTPLIATMRCYVASKFGAEVEVPDEFINNTKD